MLAVDDLIKPLTQDQVLETFLANLESIGIPARSWRKGGVARSILAVVAKIYAGFTEVMAAAIRAGFLETAQGVWLTLLAYHVFGVTRPEATFATGTVTVSNTGGGIYAFDADEVRFLSTATGKAYTNVDAFTLNPAEVKDIEVRAVEQGSASSAPPETIDALENVYPGVTVVNPAAVVGTDALSDPELRTLCRDKLGAISVRGPRGAYSYAVQTAKRPDGTPVNVNRRAVSPSSSTGQVTVYVAAPSGAPDPDDLTYIADRIEEVARPDSVTVTVLAASEVSVSRSLIVWAKRTDGVSAADIKALVDSALVNEIAAYPIGGIPKPPQEQGYLYADFLAGVAKSAHASIFDIDGTGADVLLDPGEVATLAATVTVRIVEVS